MNLLHTMCYLVYNLLRILIFCGYVPIFLNESRPIPKANKAICVAVFFIGNSLIYLLTGNNMLILLSNIILFIPYILLFKRKIYMSILCELVIYLVAMIYEGGSYFFISKFTNTLGFMSESLCAVFSLILMYLTLVVLKKIFGKMDETDIEIYHWAFLLIITLGYIYVCYPYVVVENLSDLNLYAAGAIFFILFSNIGFFYLFYEIKQLYRKKYEIYALESEKNYYKNQLDVIKESDKQISELRHDYKNHLIALKNMANTKEEKIVGYLNNMIMEVQNSKKIVACGNIVIDSLINYKFRNHEQENIKLKTNVVIPETLFVLDYHLNIILGNLIDNAIRAVESCKKKEIEVVVKYIDDALFIKVKNSYKGEINIKDGKIITTKPNKKDHGYGFGNIENALKPYHGDMDIYNEEGYFTVIIEMFPPI